MLFPGMMSGGSIGHRLQEIEYSTGVQRDRTGYCTVYRVSKKGLQLDVQDFQRQVVRVQCGTSKTKYCLSMKTFEDQVQLDANILEMKSCKVQGSVTCGQACQGWLICA